MQTFAQDAPTRSRADQLVRAGWILGVGGLVPFVVGTLLIATSSEFADRSYLWLAVSSWDALIR